MGNFNQACCQTVSRSRRMRSEGGDCMLLKLIKLVCTIATSMMISDWLGKMILSTKPLQAVLSVSNLSSACSGCLLTPREIAIKTGRTRSLSPCGVCKVLHHCSDVSSSIRLVSWALTDRNVELWIQRITRRNAGACKLSTRPPASPPLPIYRPKQSVR